MRVYPGTTVDSEYSTLGGLGHSGSLNDRQFAYLRSLGRTGSLADMFGQTTSVTVESILSGTGGVAWDSTDISTLFQDSAGSTPVTSSAQPVGRQNTFYGSTARNWQQATAGARPTYSGTGISYDGVDDHFNAFSNTAFLNNVPGAFFCEKVNLTTLTTSPTIISFSHATVGQARFMLAVSTAGAIVLSTRRLDTDGLTAASSANGVITAGVTYTVTAQSDFAGTGLAKIWVNGVEVASTTIAGSVGNTSATSSGRIRKGGNLSASPAVMTGWARRGVLAPFVMDTSERETIEAWVGAV